MYRSAPIRLPDDWVEGFPDALKAQVRVTLTEARRTFQTHWRIEDAIGFLISVISPLLSKAVQAGSLDADSAGRVMGGFLDLLVDWNPGHDWAENERRKQEIRASDAWTAFTHAIDQGVDQGGKGKPAPAEDPEIAKRRAVVRQNPGVHASGLCSLFDSQGVPLPKTMSEAGTWAKAYRAPQYRPRIDTLISKDRKA